jgi:hypothetical protein
MNKPNILQKTHDYSKFVLSDSNRVFNESHCNKITKSMAKQGFLPAFPIIVTIDKETGLYKVSDGQHRFVSAKTNNLPIYFMISESVIDPATTVSPMPWRKSDYIQRYANNGVDEYIEMLEFAKTYGITPGVAALILTSDMHDNKSEALKSGKAKITTRKEAHVAASSAVEACRINKTLLKSGLIRALFEFRKISDNVPHAEICSRVEANAAQMTRTNIFELTCEQCEIAFNYHRMTSQRKPIAYLLQNRLKELKASWGRKS